MSNTPEICPDCKQKHDEVFMEDTEGGGVKIAVGGLKSASRYLRGLAGHCACWMKEVLCLRRQLATRTIERDDLKAERYLPIDCPNCGRRRLCYWPEKNECECDKCGYSTEADARAAKEDGDTQPRRTDGGHGGNFAEPWEDTPMNESNDIIDKAYTRIMQGHVRKDRMAANETQRSLEEFAKDIRKAERKKTLEDIEALAREKSRELKSSLRRDDAVAFLVYRDFADELCRMGEEKDKDFPRICAVCGKPPREYAEGMVCSVCLEFVCTDCVQIIDGDPVCVDCVGGKENSDG